ncbi:putative amino acid transporter aATP11 [Leptomonas pyrrhocoris]|uniref:Putative amino acid transporter aATP11 n=1 Tax=Leptomonas pyrrhocoris TaxID=157538 RepID=A0A0N0DRB7_LEPPY|nr:putative amino acid transporter aATP11 [Leptomonas pyrrhocoris]XP_015652343.1 putative amino acid transporter aATP11 [Leptomonas pyrrhocoris]KPA73903.1 putative amino acid transporter aATP11 [Leptomonas pyrrhocoris]KPA73904.1 putative amino acid transporter aATP11 [Leptomonas pyrrhocoris]|eukprot:XP_015652342.1 putative amino acid transporter aATP11 [Leptomonas pyrrhocoris]
MSNARRKTGDLPEGAQREGRSQEAAAPAFADPHAGESDERAKADKYSDRLRINLSTIDVEPSGVSEVLLDGDLLHGRDTSPTAAKGAEEGVLEVGEGDEQQQPPHKRPSAFRRFFHAIVHYFNIVVPFGGFLASSFNLASATLGAGIISVPSGFNLSGIIMSCVYLVLAAAGTVYSMNLLAKVMIKTGLRTYAQSARVLLGRGVDIFLAILIIIQCFGGSVAYVIATSTLLSPILAVESSPAYLKKKSGNRLITSIVWLCCMLPLVFPKKVNSLRYVSTFGVSFIVYFVICMVAHSATHGLNDPAIRAEMKTMRTGNEALEGLGVFLFSLMVQLNAFDIFFEMQHKTVFHFTLYTTCASGTCVLLYILAGVFGYADFGDRVRDSVLSLYDPVTEPYMAVGYIGIIIKICVAFALHMIPFRDAIYHFLRWTPEEVPYWKHCLVMAIPATAALLCGLFIPTINTVLGLLGSFCGGIIGMMMPALFHMYSGNFTLREIGWLNYCATYLLLIGGVVSVVFGTVTTIYSTVGSSFVS